MEYVLFDMDGQYQTSPKHLTVGHLADQFRFLLVIPIVSRVIDRFREDLYHRHQFVFLIHLQYTVPDGDVIFPQMKSSSGMERR